MAKQSREIKYLVTWYDPAGNRKWKCSGPFDTLREAKAEVREWKEYGFVQEITRIETTTKIDCVFRSVPNGAE